LGRASSDIFRERFFGGRIPMVTNFLLLFRFPAVI
jgi:hypothetical protein